MRPPARITWAALIVLAAAAAAGGESFRLAGDSGFLWLALADKDVYQLAVKPPGKPWEKVPIRSARGRIEAFAAVGDGAVVFFGDGGHVRYYPGQGEGFRGVKPPAALWPAGTAVLSACAAADADPDAVLVLVARPVRPQGPLTEPATASAPHTRSRPLQLALLRCAGGQWQERATFPLEAPARPAHMAKLGATLYVLLEGPPPAFLAVEGGTWQRLEAPAMKKARPLALIRTGGKLLLAAMDDPQPGQVSIAPFLQKQFKPSQVLRRVKEPLTWPKHAPPAAAGFGKGIGLLWREGTGYQFAAFDLDGRLTGRSPDIFSRSRAIETVNQLWGGLLWVVPLVMIALMLWPGQPLRTAPFSLP